MLLWCTYIRTLPVSISERFLSKSSVLDIEFETICTLVMLKRIVSYSLKLVQCEWEWDPSLTEKFVLRWEHPAMNIIQPNGSDKSASYGCVTRTPN